MFRPATTTLMIQVVTTERATAMRELTQDTRRSAKILLNLKVSKTGLLTNNAEISKLVNKDFQSTC